MRINIKNCTLLVFFLTQIQISIARYHCSLATQDIEEIHFNETSKTLTKEKDGNIDDETDILYAKKCPCDDSWYCIINNEEDMCSVSRGYFVDKDITYCYKRQNFYTRFLRLMWVPSICLLVIVLVMPFTTVLGRNATGFVFSSCFPYIRRRRIDQMIQNEIRSISNQVDLDASFGRDDGMVEQTILKLKTKYLSKDNAVRNQENVANVENVCLICMASLGEGEKIGDLSCGHSYHVDCLKQWLQRRNACPLCDTQVADSEVVLVTRDEAFADDDGEIDEETRNRYDRLLNFYHRRTTRRMHSTIN